MARCKLCLEEKTLIGKSHIIPDFMYQDLYDDKHKLYAFSPSDRREGVGRVNKPSTGEYQGGLLCKECDGGIIGAYETYAKLAIEGGLPADQTPIVMDYVNQHGLKGSLCKNLDYKNYKLFLLSILWRASICSRPFFAQIQLGPHEEKLRRMILEGDPGNVSDYPIVFMTYINEKDMPRDLIAQPCKKRNGNGNVFYAFIIGGFFYNFFVNSSEHYTPDFVREETISPQNEAHIYHLSEQQSWDILRGYYGLNRNSQ